MKIYLCHRATFSSSRIQPTKDAPCCFDAGQSPLSPRPKGEHQEIKQDFDMCSTDAATTTSAVLVSLCVVLRCKPNPIMLKEIHVPGAPGNL